MNSFYMSFMYGLTTVLSRLYSTIYQRRRSWPESGTSFLSGQESWGKLSNLWQTKWIVICPRGWYSLFGLLWHDRKHPKVFWYHQCRIDIMNVPLNENNERAYTNINMYIILITKLFVTTCHDGTKIKRFYTDLACIRSACLFNN